MIPEFIHLRFIMRIIAGVFTIFVLVFIFVLSNVFLQFGGTSPQFPIDCAIVFGTAVGKGSTPSPGIKRRVEAATDLYQLNYIKTLIFSGGKGSDWQESEASVMRKVAMVNGVDPDDIVIEEKSTSTLENLKFTKALLDGKCSSDNSSQSNKCKGNCSAKEKYDNDCKGHCPAPESASVDDRCGVYDCTSYIAISDRYHLARIRYLAYKLGWGILDTYPAQITPSKSFELTRAIREALGIIYYGIFLRNL